MSKICPNCGEELAEDSKFCISCGTNLSSNIVETNYGEVNSNPDNNGNYNNSNFNNSVYLMDMKSPTTAAVLSFFVCGLGYSYIGKVGTFLLYFLGALVLGFLSFITLGIGLLFLLILWIYQIYAVHRDTKKYNMQQHMLYQNM